MKLFLSRCGRGLVWVGTTGAVLPAAPHRRGYVGVNEALGLMLFDWWAQDWGDRTSPLDRGVERAQDTGETSEAARCAPRERESLTSEVSGRRHDRGRTKPEGDFGP